MTFASTALAHNNSPSTMAETDVFDSGALTHMSPTQDQFISMRTIPSKPIKAADNMIFHANAMGNMCISIPNGERTSHVVLKDVLYCPDLAFTLVSLSRCDLASYLALLKDQQCHICNSQGTTVGQVPILGSLYKVT